MRLDARYLVHCAAGASGEMDEDYEKRMINILSDLRFQIKPKLLGPIFQNRELWCRIASGCDKGPQLRLL